MPSESELNSLSRAGAMIVWRVRAEQPEQGGEREGGRGRKGEEGGGEEKGGRGEGREKGQCVSE